MLPLPSQQRAMVKHAQRRACKAHPRLRPASNSPNLSLHDITDDLENDLEIRGSDIRNFSPKGPEWLKFCEAIKIWKIRDSKYQTYRFPRRPDFSPAGDEHDLHTAARDGYHELKSQRPPNVGKYRRGLPGNSHSFARSTATS
jgi:hypothetical protein